MTHLLFSNRIEFRRWLELNHRNGEGIWLIFDKSSKKMSLSAAEALEEALCFGWIDGQIKSIDDSKYLKYFKERRKGSVWSERNKQIINTLIDKGLMTEFGFGKIEQAKKDGTWNAAPNEPINEDVIIILENKLRDNHKAYENYMNMAPSARKGYAMHYHTAKSEETKNKRLIEIADRLEKNLKPMERDPGKLHT